MLLSACSWFHRKEPPVRDPPQLIVTGAAVDSIVFVDDIQKGQQEVTNDKPQVVIVTEGTHKVEVRIGDRVVYREDVFVASGERRVVMVLSGSNRE
jgi:cyanophycinase-like exopeptidase